MDFKSSTCIFLWVGIILGGCGKPNVPTGKADIALEPVTLQTVEAEDKKASSATELSLELERKNAEEKMLQVLRLNLKDPDSAKFRNVKVAKLPYDQGRTSEAYAVCGEVNSKNSFGGYSGFEGFVVANNIHGEPSVYMQNQEFVSTLWEGNARLIGCIGQ